MTGDTIVVAPVHFIKWLPLYENEKPFNIFINLPEDAQDTRTNNLEFDVIDTSFHNVRGQEDKFSLDEQGFEFIQWPHTFKNFGDRAAVETEYLPQIEKFIREKIPDAEEIALFEWRLRDNSTMNPGELRDLEEPTERLRPSLHPHIDHATKPILDRIQATFPENYKELLNKRVRVLNLWHPMRHRVENWPLGLADGSNISLNDFLETDHVRRKYVGASLNLMHRPEYQWHYLKDQMKDEAILFKNFDSSGNVKAHFAPHVSFPHPEARDDAIRESFEVRMLIFSKE
ncbi:unnamed protein product [Periconia digitata]|uniref:Methyltransferase n=1 Tax=Periconia digitata TaxID=1303443 RepID=A0A9W4UA53_9PLEO|nr:unnamed protein product [Periconia digitata]